MARSLSLVLAFAAPVLLLGPLAIGCRDGCSSRATGDASPASSSPSDAAPDVVTSASTVEGEGAYDGGAAMKATDLAGAIDGEALRKRSHVRIAADKSAVTILRGARGARDLGARLCEAVVPSRPKETPILIKPNIGGFEWFKDPEKNQGDNGVKGRTTDPEFVRGIVRCLKARGHEKITIAEGFAHTHASWEKLTQVSGYAAMAREEKVALVAMDDDGVFDVEGDQPGKPLRVSGMEKTHVPTLLVPKILAEHLEHGLFISAPKLKAHRFGVVSIGIKGMQGTVMLSDASPAFHQKWRTHKELKAALDLLKTDPPAGKKAYLASLDVFAERMSDLLEISAPDVVLAEGAPAMGGDGFGQRWPSEGDVAVGGTNPILVDRVGAQVLGLWDNDDLARELGGHKTSPLIETAAKRFGVDIAHVDVVGDGASLIAAPASRPVHFVSMSGFSIHKDVASPFEARAARFDDDAITIDGVSDPVWKTAPPVTFDTDWSGKPTGTRTTARFGWSKTALYALFELEGADIAVDASRPIETERVKLYEEDCIEIFFGPDAGDRKRYYEIEVGPLGHFFDIAIDRSTKKSDIAWSSKPTIATNVDRAARKATIEIALRAPEIATVLRKGSRYPFALYRMEGRSPRQYLAWSPTRTPKPDFHVPDAFGTLVLEDTPRIH